MGHQSFFQQAPQPAGVPKDPRPLKDRLYQTKIGQELLDYMSQNNFEMEMKHMLSQNTIRSPTQKDFIFMFQWLYHRIDPSYRFQIGKARELRDGKDVGIISTGFMTERALDAAEILAKDGTSVAVLHVPTIKPFDADAVAAFAARVDRVVTAENHVAVGGLSSLVVETLFDAGISRKVTRVGLPDRYIECGAVPTLQARYGLTTESVVARIAALR